MSAAASGGERRGEFHQPVGRVGNNSMDQIAGLRNIVDQPNALADSYIGRLEIIGFLSFLHPTQFLSVHLCKFLFATLIAGSAGVALVCARATPIAPN
jgi:hypothetical protein